MAKIEIKKVEEQRNHRFLYSVRVSGETDHMEFLKWTPVLGPAVKVCSVLLCFH